MPQKEIKEKIIKFDLEIWANAPFKPEIPFSQILPKILSELEKEHKEWLKSGFTKKESDKFRGKKLRAKRFQNFIQFLKEKYANKS